MVWVRHQLLCVQNAGAPTPIWSKYQICSTILFPQISLEELSDGVGAGVRQTPTGVVVAASSAGVCVAQGIL